MLLPVKPYIREENGNIAGGSGFSLASWFVLSRLNGVFTFQMVLTRSKIWSGLEWGSIAAARQRFVWHERVGGGTVIWGMRPVGTVPRPRPVPVKIIHYRGGSGRGWPARRAARRGGPLSCRRRPRQRQRIRRHCR